MADPILLARHGGESCFLLPGMANRHGLITGATGTGKTVTLQKLAESFSHMGVPVFLADVKGDLTGISQSGPPPWKSAACPCRKGAPAPSRSGTCSARKATPCAPPFQTWGRCCWAACWA